jgi:glycosyltransferase involved in cell wall biosynthesis
MPDIMHGTNYSVFPCKDTVNLMSLYDLSFMKYPEYVNSAVKQYTKRVQQSLQWTDAILTISESSKRDIIEYLQISPDRIFVTPLASRYHVNYLTDELISRIDNNIGYDFSQPYLLFVSTIEPRKNIGAIISAFNLLKSEHKIPHNLVLIGQKGWNYEPIFQEIERSSWKENIHHLDYLSDELVALFYSRADVFVYPSHYEGFGLPVLEAMTLGAPVVTSSTSSLPEVAGDAALLVNPSDVEEQAHAILQIISDSKFRDELITKGKARATLFSWDRTARETLEVYKSIHGMKT